MEVEQLVLPKECRQVALVMSHDIPITGHQGRDRTRQRLLRRFFWPSIFCDVTSIAKAAVLVKGLHLRGLSQHLRYLFLCIVSEPFSHIAMDIVDPLPRSRAGNKYILVHCDYATRYPEAVPLKSIDAESVAEELSKVFCQGAYQGANFTSQLLADLYTSCILYAQARIIPRPMV